MKLRTVWLGILLILVCWIPRCEANDELAREIQIRYQEAVEKLPPELARYLQTGLVPVLPSGVQGRITSQWVTVFNPYTSQSTIVGVSYVPAPQ